MIVQYNIRAVVGRGEMKILPVDYAKTHRTGQPALLVTPLLLLTVPHNVPDDRIL